MNVLVLNVGSSSLKFQLVRTDDDRLLNNTDERLAKGMVERVGGEAIYTYQPSVGGPQRGSIPLPDHRSTLGHLLTWLTSDDSGAVLGSIGEIDAVGHRVVHGGELFKKSVLITPDVQRGIENNIDLAPLHNPANLRGIAAAREVLGAGVPQVAVFDTAFHQTLPPQAYLYAIPYQLYRRHSVRRYGFHGTSHRYVAARWRKLTERSREETNIITLHLGNGCSACAIAAGDSVDTSMGFTPLEGLVMGTRSGDLDPALLEHVAVKEGLSQREMSTLLNKHSGLLGISGLTNDMRELLQEADENDDRRARLAIEVFCYRARKYIGSYLAAMGGAQAIVFTGGIGENSARIRTGICDGLQWMGMTLDETRNHYCTDGREGIISAEGSRLDAWVIPTDEELLIARDCYRVVTGTPTPF